MCFGDECSARKTSTDRKCQPLQMQLSKVQRMLSILLRRASENVDEESPFFLMVHTSRCNSCWINSTQNPGTLTQMQVDQRIFVRMVYSEVGYVHICRLWVGHVSTWVSRRRKRTRNLACQRVISSIDLRQLQVQCVRGLCRIISTYWMSIAD